MNRRALGVALACAMLGLSCVGPVVERRSWGGVEGAFEKVAIVPFRPWPAAARARQPIGGPPPEAPEIVAQMVGEEIEALGFEVIFAVEVAPVVIGEQDAVGPFDPETTARAVATRFGATSVVIGTVHRYRDRAGEAMGTMEAASVSFEVTAYDAQGRPLRAAVFDETQKSVSENLFNVFRYPGGGTRWLRADELARWGASASAEALTEP